NTLAGVSGFILALLIVSLINHNWTSDIKFNILKNFDTQDNELISGDTTNPKFEQMLFHAYDSTITNASLKLDAAAGSFLLKDTCTNLIQVNTFTKIGESNLNIGIEETTANVYLDLSLDNIFKKSKSKRKANIMLNHIPRWDVSLNLGACSFEADLTQYKIGNINLEGGASNIELKLGEPADTTYLAVSVGASNLEVHVPNWVACEINSNTGLTKKDYRGFSFINGQWLTENHSTAPKRIIINIEGGVSNIQVSRY
ncbi:MAG: hypothetical protein WCT77_09200, partial [Bacteroidota bacterium]